MYDEGSDTTLLRRGLILWLKLAGERQNFTVYGTAGLKTDSELVDLKMKTTTGDFVLRVLTLPCITRPVAVVDWGKLKREWKHLAYWRSHRSTHGPRLGGKGQ